MPYVLAALAIGFVIPMQAAINNQLKIGIGGSTLLAAFVSFSVGTVALAAVATLTGERWRSLGAIGDLPWWQLLGGILGAFFVFGTTFLAPRIGLAKMAALIIAGQVIISLAMDHQGWLGLAVRELSPMRALGAALVVAGVVLVNYDSIFGAA